MLEDIWNGILELSAKLVIPDWGALVNLIPIGLLVIVAIWLIMTVRRFATAGPTRRGGGRITPLPPPGVHAPGPSYAPFLAAAGAGVLFWTLVVGGSAIILGIVVLALTLLYWGREAIVEYDHLVDAKPLPPPEHGEAPHGVHMIGPSFRPVLASLAMTVLLFGLVFGGWLLLVGFLFLVATLLGWLRDARAEYHLALEGDVTGHVPSLPAPAWPKRLLWIFGVLVVAAIVVDAGILPPRSTEEGVAGGPGASPGAPGAPPGGPAAGDVVVAAEGVKFLPTELTAPGGAPFTIAFDNKDAQIAHDVDINGPDGTKIFDGEVVTGPTQTVYEVDALEPGSYGFVCSVHPNMTGTLTVQ